MDEGEIKSTLHLILKMIRPFPWSIAVMLLVAIAWAVDLSLRPYVLKIILNRAAAVSSNNVWHYLAMPAIAFIIISFIHSSIFRLYGYFVENKMIPRLRQRVTNYMFNYLLGHSHRYYQNQFAGSLTNKVSDLSSSVPDILQIVVDRFFSHSLALLVAIFTLWQVNMNFALAVILWAVFLFAISLPFSKRIQHYADSWSEYGASITGKIVDALSNILSIRLFANAKSEKERLNVTIEAAVAAEQKMQWTYFLMWCFYGYSFVLMQAWCLFYLIQGRQQGWISIGDFALVLGINMAIVDFMWQLVKEFSNYSKHMGRITQALRTINVPQEIKDSPYAAELAVKHGEIIFDRVGFQYEGSDHLFEEKSIVINPGEKVGLVGYSGSGKSTFVNLILRLFDVTSGHIFIDGQDIRYVTQDSLHQSIGMIPQDPILFHRSLRDNIHYGNMTAPEEEIVQAAKRAHAHEFIINLPQGFDSLVGERGVKLSGGQRQRIAIARAILKNAPILILDEATSQLDSITENYIQDSLWDLMQGKTTLVIAHRLSTLLHMDRILVFDKGRIVEDGSHAQLLQAGGKYKTLWDAQVGGFLVDEGEAQSD